MSVDVDSKGHSQTSAARSFNLMAAEDQSCSAGLQRIGTTTREVKKEQWYISFDLVSSLDKRIKRKKSRQATRNYVPDYIMGGGYTTTSAFRLYAPTHPRKLISEYREDM
jgi:hypothetical protein